jgi:Fic family protein
LRLIEIQPFEDANQSTALVAASFFLLRAGLPPLIIPNELSRAYETALDEASRLNTRPMVELVAEATSRTLSKLILRASGK